jgi:hypothetical protein
MVGWWLVTRTSRVVRPDPRGGLLLEARPWYRKVGRGLLWAAAATALPAAAFHVAFSLPGFWILPGVLLLPGLLLATNGPVARIDPKNRTLESRGVLWSAGDYVAVLTVSASPPDESAYERIWSVGLVARGHEESSDEVIAELEEILARVPKAVEDERDELLARLLRWAVMTVGSTETLVTTPSEHEAWYAGEAVARALHVPSIDLSGGRPLLRAPGELNRPLGEALVAAGEVIEDPGPAPGKLSVRDDPARIHMAWTTGQEIVWRPAVVVAAVWLGAVAIGMLWDWMMASMMLPLAFLLPCLIVFDQGWGKMELELDLGERRLRYTRRRPWRTRVQTIELDALEKICYRAKPHSVLSLLSDDRVLRLYTGDTHGPWIHAKLTHWLHADALRRRTRADSASSSSGAG